MEVEAVVEKMCSKCGKVKPLSEFIRNSAARDGRRPECKECYRRQRGFVKQYRRRPENGVEGMLLCLKCNQFKALDQFTNRLSSRGTGKLYYNYVCRECAGQRMASYYARYSEEIKARVRDKTYGLEAGEYNSWLSHQEGRCAICRKTPEEVGILAVDHDHATGEYRGLLCANCNKGLGHFRDSQDSLQNAILYLRGDYEKL